MSQKWSSHWCAIRESKSSFYFLMDSWAFSIYYQMIISTWILLEDVQLLMLYHIFSRTNLKQLMFFWKSQENSRALFGKHFRFNTWHFMNLFVRLLMFVLRSLCDLYARCSEQSFFFCNYKQRIETRATGCYQCYKRLSGVHWSIKEKR